MKYILNTNFLNSDYDNYDNRIYSYNYIPIELNPTILCK